MTPAYALDLNHDSIRLLEQGSDGWIDLGGATLSDPDFSNQLRSLRDLAEMRGGPGFETLLVIPESQILYTTVRPEGRMTRLRDEDVASALESVTPLPLEELVFDWRQTADGIRVAVLEITTLDEAEGFAAQYGFNPVAFTADARPDQFPEAPDFGPVRALRGGAADTPAFASVRAEGDGASAPAPGPAPPASAAPRASRTIPKAPSGAVQPAPARAAKGPANNAPGIFGNWGMPFAAAEGFRGPGAIILAVLLAVTALVWLAFYLVRPEDQSTVLPDAEPAAEDVAVAVPEPQPEALPEPEPEPAPAPAPEPQETPQTGAAAPEVTVPTRTPTRNRIGTPQDTQSPVPPLPVADSSLGRDDMRARQRLASFAPDTRQIGALAELRPLPQPPAFAPPPARTAAPVALLADSLAPAPQIDTDLGQRVPDPVWVVLAAPPAPPLETELDSLYVASIDPVILSGDAFALSPPPARDLALPQPASLPEPGAIFVVDETGRVTATPEGALTPEGTIVTAGRPPLTPPPRPTTGAFAPPPETNVALALEGLRPRARPTNLVEQNERATLGGLSRAELGGLRPRARPESAQAAAMAAAVDAAVEEAITNEDATSPTAVQASRAPRSRPSNFAALVETARAAERRDAAAAVSANVATPERSGTPGTTSVARAATIESALNLRRVNLIGIYGSNAERRALVRLGNGRYVKVQVGDRLDGGQVEAITTAGLRYNKAGRSITLRLPEG